MVCVESVLIIMFCTSRASLELSMRTHDLPSRHITGEYERMGVILH